MKTDDAAQLAVHDTNGDGPAVVLVHGFTLDHTILAPLASRLESRGYRVVSPDLRGHGQSTLGHRTPDIECFTRDTLAVVNDLDVSDVHLVGHSLGGFVALHARSRPDLADRLSSVVAISAMARSLTNPLKRLGAQIFSSRVAPAMLRRRRLGRAMVTPWFGPAPSDTDLDAVRKLSARCAQPARRSIASATARIDLRAGFVGPGPPTLVACGRRDVATPLRHSEAIAAAIEDSRLVVIDDAGHMVITERPDALANELNTWFAQHQRPSS